MFFSIVTDIGIYSGTFTNGSMLFENNNTNIEMFCCFSATTFEISIKNIGSKPINLNKFILKLVSTDVTNYLNYSINPENPMKNISIKTPVDLKSKEKAMSFLFSFFISKDNYQNIICGFLSSHSSRNYIEIERDNDIFNISAVCDFVNQSIEPESILKLDKIYFETARNYFELFNNYADSISNQFCTSKQNVDPYEYLATSKNISEDSILFTEHPIKESVEVNKKPIQINCSGVKLYPIDLSKENAIASIVDRYKNTQNDNSCLVHIKNIIPYLNVITDLKQFNVYNKISNLLIEIKKNIKNVNLIFSDCPDGIAIGNMEAIERTINIKEPSGFISKILSHQPNEDIYYDFIIKTIVRKNILSNNTTFLVQNKKIEQAFEIIAKSTSSSNNMAFNDIFSDIDDRFPVIANIDKDNTFEMLRYGKKAVYIAVFNLSNNKKRIFWDFSLQSKLPVNDGVGVDIFSRNNYMVVNGKIDIRRLGAKDCCLIRKPLSNIIKNMSAFALIFFIILLIILMEVMK